MTKKDYNIIARAINQVYSEHKNTISQGAINEIVVNLINEMHNDNSRFDEDKFRKAIYN